MATRGRKPGCKKTGGRDWGPGNPPPKSMGCRMSSEARQLRKLTTDEFIKRVTKYFHAPKDKLENIVTDGKSTSLDVYICTCILGGIKSFNYDTLDKMLNRIIGPVKVKLEHTGEDGGAIILDFNKDDEKL